MSCENIYMKVEKPLRWRKICTVSMLFFLLIPIFFSAELISVLMLVFLFFIISISSFRIPAGLGLFLWPIFLIILTGLIGSFGNSPYDIFKDVWYIGKSLLALIVGYLMMFHIKDLRVFLKLIVIVGTITAFFHIGQFLSNPSIINESIFVIRSELGNGYFICILSIVVIIISWRARINLFPNAKWFSMLAVFACFLSLSLSFSRTLWISFLIILFFIFDFYKLSNIKTIVRVCFLVALVFLTVLFFINILEGSFYSNIFLDKVMTSFDEIWISDYSNHREITMRWRGYESYNVLMTYLEGSSWELFRGLGFGTLVDVGLYMHLGGEAQRYLPVFHNGYLYVLLKTGVVGLLLYLFYLYTFIRFGLIYANSLDYNQRDVGKLLTSIGVIFIMTSIVTMGFFNKSVMSSVIVVLGALIAYVRLNIHGHKV